MACSASRRSNSAAGSPTAGSRSGESSRKHVAPPLPEQGPVEITSYAVASILRLAHYEGSEQEGLLFGRVIGNVTLLESICLAKDVVQKEKLGGDNNDVFTPEAESLIERVRSGRSRRVLGWCFFRTSATPRGFERENAVHRAFYNLHRWWPLGSIVVPVRDPLDGVCLKHWFVRGADRAPIDVTVRNVGSTVDLASNISVISAPALGFFRNAVGDLDAQVSKIRKQTSIAVEDGLEMLHRNFHEKATAVGKEVMQWEHATMAEREEAKRERARLEERLESARSAIAKYEKCILRERAGETDPQAAKTAKPEKTIVTRSVAQGADSSGQKPAVDPPRTRSRSASPSRRDSVGSAGSGADRGNALIVKR